MSFGYSPDCRRVGQEVEFGDTRVAYEDVLPVRDAAARSFFEASTTQEVALSEYGTAMAGALFLRGMTEYDINMPNASLAIKVSHESMPDGWRLTAGIGSFYDFRGPNKKQMWYRIETLGDEVLAAVKSVKFILDKTEVIIEDSEPGWHITPDRKMYEKPMEPADCVALAAKLEQAARRASSRKRDPLAVNPLSFV